MRPFPGNDAWIGRQRSADHDPPPLMASSTSSQMSFFLADESSIDSYLDHPTPHSRFLDIRKAGTSAGASHSRRDDKDRDGEMSKQNTMQQERDYAPAYSITSRDSVFTHSPASMRSQLHSSPSRPMTPMMLGTSCTGSAMSSPSSRRNSFTGSLSEHAVSSDEEPLEQGPSRMMDSGSAPQLVMPSIKMPSRRPFTETGKSLGRLKVLFAGDSGVGKTSMVKAVVQICEHIVHVDPIPSQADSPVQKKQVASSRRASNSTPIISEIYASTKPYPEWWSPLNEPHVSERRKSLGDNLLERNVCFVDTPGYRNGSSAMETIMPCVEYVESHLTKISSDSLSDSDMLNMLGGDGGFQVDVVFYLISQGLKPVDLEYIRRLAPLTNVIPILARADSIPPEQLVICKEQIAGQLRAAGIRTFSFASATNEESNSPVPSVPYAVSSATGSDDDVMDASLLMSPDYVQPLMTSELRYLVENMFSPNGISWLRHIAAKKYLEWRDTTPSRPRHLYRPLNLPSLAPPPPAQPQTTTIAPCSSMALTRLNEQHQDHGPSQLHIVDWAADLQRSLATERTRYESLARGERAVWLTEKLNECVQDGTLVALKKTKSSGSMPTRRKSRGRFSAKTTPHQDPLGLLQVAADLKAKGWVALEVIGSLGVIGGLAFWLSRHHWHVDPIELADEWARHWGMDI
ncbi:Septin-domain-containing protein [Hypoxylon trugodes]|uniref:Septin-domain-containing protein n=1 Tax=Hypoxylon trugodes TaxID=326681 RepID=UPI00219FBBB7|nr:Septin-domain-containing protein [Hypoxylon trugodes]KAI1384703.1 Septin-domain-containing protein [Hypoxylon trugodes]